MNIRWNASPERDEEINKALPKNPITETLLLPALREYIIPVLLKCLKQEIEVYKNFPKQGKYKPVNFDPRNPRTCFVGQGFRSTFGTLETITDSDLSLYRAQVGTIPHAVWGQCTLLEIWGADHFEKYKDMVTKVFEYGWKKRKTLPKLVFEFMPFLIDKEASKPTKTEQDIEDEKYRNDMLVKGIVTTEKERRKSGHSRK